MRVCRREAFEHLVTAVQLWLCTLDLSISMALRFMMSLVSLTLDWMIILCSFSSCESISVFWHHTACYVTGNDVWRCRCIQHLWLQLAVITVLPPTCFTCITVTFSLYPREMTSSKANSRLKAACSMPCKAHEPAGDCRC